MEHIGKTLDKAQQAARTPPQDDKQRVSDHKKAMIVMWTAMAHAFGSAWISQYGTSEEHAFRSWSKALEAYNPEQIRRGVKNSANPDMWGSTFPPNLNEFKRLCLAVKLTHHSHKPFQIERQVKRSSPETAKAEIGRLTDMLNGKTQPDTEAAMERYERILNGEAT